MLYSIVTSERKHLAQQLDTLLICKTFLEVLPAYPRPNDGEMLTFSRHRR